VPAHHVLEDAMRRRITAATAMGEECTSSSLDACMAPTVPDWAQWARSPVTSQVRKQMVYRMQRTSVAFAQRRICKLQKEQ
jgi:hypothetical protein